MQQDLHHGSETKKNENSKCIDNKKHEIELYSSKFIIVFVAKWCLRGLPLDYP